jgi:hypothetical protein
MQNASVLGHIGGYRKKKAIKNGQWPVYHMKAKLLRRVDPLSLASLLETDCALALSS